MLPHKRHASYSIVDRSQKLRHYRQTQITIDWQVIVEELPNVNRNIRDPRTADVDGLEKPVDDLKLPAAADRTRESALRHWLDAESFRSLFGDNRHARSGIEHELQRRFLSVDTNIENRTIVRCLERNSRTVVTTRHVK